jgi:hypothetical protein
VASFLITYTKLRKQHALEVLRAGKSQTANSQRILNGRAAAIAESSRSARGDASNRFMLNEADSRA